MSKQTGKQGEGLGPDFYPFRLLCVRQLRAESTLILRLGAKKKPRTWVVRCVCRRRFTCITVFYRLLG